jgi:5-methylcytosine-specific restriction protein B
MSDLKVLWNEFLTEWPIERVKNMTLKEYVGFKDKTTFTYWLETKTLPIANIKGSTSYKFGIFKRDPHKEVKEKAGTTQGEEYSWYSRFGETEQAAFLKIRETILTVIKAAKTNDLDTIENASLANLFKWKIAFLYQQQNKPCIVNIFSKDKLDELTDLPGKVSFPDYYQELMRSYEPGKYDDVAVYGKSLWLQLEDEASDEATSQPAISDATDIRNEQSPLNQILYGPPGTGKTYHTIPIAVKAADPDFYAELAIDEKAGLTTEQRKALTAQYQQLLDTKQIRFVTFHQSYGYEEFVEGLKAKTDNGSVRYDVEPGIFRQLVESAIPKRISDKNSTQSSYELEKRNIWKMSLGNTLTEEGETVYNECLDNNYILLGYGDDINFTGCNDTAKIKKKYTEAGYTLKPQDYNVTAVNTLVNKMKIGDLVVVSDGNYKFKAIAEVTSDYTYLSDDREGFFQKRDVKWLLTFEESRPVEELCSSNLSQMTLYHLNDSVISREKLSGLLNKTRDEIEKIKNHVLIIDEINRGNISKIFGELITLIEPSKRSGKDKNGKENEEALSVTLPHSGKTFSVPNNLYLIGTMNTADRSLAMMDTALRRRFDFVEMMPEPKKLQGKLVNGIDLERLLIVLNERIEVLYDREHTLGHAFFMPVVDLRDGNEQKGIEANEQAAFIELQNTFKNKIIPLLEEYFFEDWNKIRLVLGDNCKKSDALSQYVFIQQHTASYNDIFGSGHGLETYEDKKTTYKLADFNDESAAWHQPLAYKAIYDATVLKAVEKSTNSDDEQESSNL